MSVLLFLGVAQAPAAIGVETPAVPLADWAVIAGASEENTFPTAMASTGDGTVVVGSFSDSTTLGTGLDAVTVTPAGGPDTYLASYRDDGTLDWAVTIGSTGYDRAGGVAVAPVAPDGTITVAGFIVAFATFGSASAAPAITVSQSGFQSGYVARYGPDGSPIWVSQAGNGTTPNEVAVGPDGEAVVAGNFESASTTFGTGPNSVTLADRGNGDVFVARYLAGGSLDWAVSAGGSSLDTANSVAVGVDGSATVTGRYQGVATFGSGTEQVTFEDTFRGGSYVARYGPDGALDRVLTGGGGPGDASGHAVAVRPDGSTVVAGSFGKYTGTGTFGSGAAAVTKTSRGATDIYVAEYAPDGTLKWLRTAGGRWDDAPRDLALAPDGSFSVTGIVEHSLDPGVTFDSDAGPVNLTTYGWLDAFLASYDAAGSLQWATAVGSDFRDFGQAVTRASDGTVVWAGRFVDSGSFATVDGELVLTSLGTGTISNGFLARYGVSGVDETAPTVTITSPADGSSHLLNSSLIADYGCMDEVDGSGVATCTGPIADGAAVDTSGVGAGTFNVTAADNAGNQASAASSYDVVYGFSGYAAPIQEGTNLVTAGRKLALRFSAFDANGAPVTDIASVRAIALRFACTAEDVTDAIEEEVFGTPGLKNKGDGSYQYNFPTSRAWAGTCRTLGIDLGDGVVRSVDFQFR